MTARQDLKDKLALEKKLKPKVQAFNRKIVRNFVSKYAKNSEILDMDQFTGELEEILRTHYADTTEVFSGRMEAALPERLGLTDEEKAAIAAALLIFFGANAAAQAKTIAATTQTNIRTALDEANDDPLVRGDEGIDGRITAATLAGAYLARKLNARADGIVVTETQFAAETVKATEAEVAAGLTPTISGGDRREVEVTKEWWTVGDNRVRPAHAAADGQVKKINEPYEVGGELLMRPRDTSLGASVGNVINCRCSSIVNEKEIRKLRESNG